MMGSYRGEGTGDGGPFFMLPEKAGNATFHFPVASNGIAWMIKPHFVNGSLHSHLCGVPHPPGTRSKQ